jgi:hypothetical protein
MAFREGAENRGKDEMMSLPAFVLHIGWDLTANPAEDAAKKAAKSKELSDLYNAHLRTAGAVALRGASLEENPQQKAT